MSSIVIAIDGPVGVGKTTVARQVSEQLGYFHLDSGAMYRSVTLELINRNLDIFNESDVEQLLKDIEIDLIPTDSGLQVMCNGKDVTEAIRSEEINKKISPVADSIPVRMKVNELARKIAENKRVVVEGRDIQTVVFPNAKYKFFLAGDTKVRAERRWKEFQAKGLEYKFDDILDSVAARDKCDAMPKRPFGALKKADDAATVDTTNLTIAQVVEEIVSKVDQADRN